MKNETSTELQRRLDAAPYDDTLRARLARLLEVEGRSREAVEVLLARFINFTAHDEPTLPCLCQRCLDPDRLTAAQAGMTYRREFAVTNGRLLFFWVPEQLRHRPRRGDAKIRAPLRQRPQ